MPTTARRPAAQQERERLQARRLRAVDLFGAGVRQAATIEVSDDVSGTSFPVAVSVSWTGFGDTFSQDDRFHLKEPGLKVNFHLDGTFREATASGTVTDGTSNLTPEPALVTGNTRLGSIRVGEVDIIHQ